MVEQSSDVAPNAESSQEDEQEPIKDLISGLPSDVVESYKKAHEALFSSLTTPSTIPSPSLPPSTACTRIQRKVLGWTKPVTRLWRLMRSRRYGETYVRVIALEVIDKESNIGLVFGIAMIDYWSPCNMISRDFGDRIVQGLESATPYRLVDTVAGPANAVKKVKARWNCRDDTSIEKPLLRFDPTMDESNFHIMEHKNRFDVIIGRPDIVKFDILDANKRLFLAAANLFRSRPHAIDDRTVNENEERARLERQLELEEMRRDDEHKRYHDEYARNRAHRYALAFADDCARRYGPEYYDGSYRQRYALEFPLAQADYTRNHPRTA